MPRHPKRPENSAIVRRRPRDSLTFNDQKNKNEKQKTEIKSRYFVKFPQNISMLQPSLSR